MTPIDPSEAPIVLNWFPSPPSRWRDPTLEAFCPPSDLLTISEAVLFSFSMKSRFWERN